MEPDLIGRLAVSAVVAILPTERSEEGIDVTIIAGVHPHFVGTQTVDTIDAIGSVLTSSAGSASGTVVTVSASSAGGAVTTLTAVFTIDAIDAVVDMGGVTRAEGDDPAVRDHFDALHAVSAILAGGTVSTILSIDAVLAVSAIGTVLTSKAIDAITASGTVGTVLTVNARGALEGGEEVFLSATVDLLPDDKRAQAIVAVDAVVASLAVLAVLAVDAIRAIRAIRTVNTVAAGGTSSAILAVDAIRAIRTVNTVAA